MKKLIIVICAAAAALLFAAGLCACSHVHSYTAVKVEPTCTTGGYIRYSCPCGDHYDEQQVAPLGHRYDYEDIEWEWAEDGTAVAKAECMREECSPQAEGHVFTCSAQISADVVKAATCSAEGLEEYTSYIIVDGVTYTCPKKFERVTEKTAHSPVGDGNAVAATCVQDGFTQSISCSACGQLLTERKVVPALGHVPCEDAEVLPTCTQSGLTEGSHCTRCGEILTEQKIVAALGHSAVIEPAAAPTCTQSGYTAGSHCSRCNLILQRQEYIAPLGHDLIEHDGMQPTCTASGYKDYVTCSRCDYTDYKEISALGHAEVVDAAVPATCTMEGLTEGSHCSRCNAVLKEQRTVAKLAHDFGADGLNCQGCGVFNPQFVAISDATGLQNISADPDGKYYLTQDIDLGSVNWTPIGVGVEAFSGVLDGNGKTIHNLCFIAENSESAKNSSGGLFTTNNGVIRNLKIDNVSVRNVFKEISDNSKAQDYGDVTITFGAFAAINGGTIENCEVTGNVSLYAERWLEAYFTWVSAGSYDETDRTYIYFGGITGVNNGLVSECVNSGACSTSVKAYVKSWYGAIGGFNNSNTWAVAFLGNVGGIAGTNNADILSCSMSGSFAHSSTLTADCKKNGTTSGNKCVAQNSLCVGSLVGYNTQGALLSGCSYVKCTFSKNHAAQGNTDRAAVYDFIRNDGANGIYGANDGAAEGNMLS